MNLVKAQELAKGMDPARLQKFADGFAPDLIPPWLATGEIQAQMQRAQKMQAMQETGLKWQKIYKWMFDLKTKYAHLVLNPVFGLQQLPKKPIFKIEKFHYRGTQAQ